MMESAQRTEPAEFRHDPDGGATASSHWGLLLQRVLNGVIQVTVKDAMPAGDSGCWSILPARRVHG